MAGAVNSAGTRLFERRGLCLQKCLKCSALYGNVTNALYAGYTVGPGGEIGKHTSLRSWRPYGFAGSSPASATIAFSCGGFA